MNIVRHSMDEIYDSEELYNQIKELVLSKDLTSVFYSEVVVTKKRHNIEALICYDKNNKIMGWARLVDTTNTKTIRPKMQFGVFVDPRHRNKGIASALLNHAELIATEKARSLVVRPWDKVSKSFFKEKHGYHERVGHGRYVRSA